MDGLEARKDVFLIGATNRPGLILIKNILFLILLLNRYNRPSYFETRTIR